MKTSSSSRFVLLHLAFAVAFTFNFVFAFFVCLFLLFCLSSRRDLQLFLLVLFDHPNPTAPSIAHFAMDGKNTLPQPAFAVTCSPPCLPKLPSS
jgi:hypothetical protein